MKKNKNKISKRLVYTLIGIFLIIIVGVGVFAAIAPFDGIIPSPGHSINEIIGAPSGCSAGQVLAWSGSAWTCVSRSSSITDSRFQMNLSIAPDKICYPWNTPVCVLTNRQCSGFSPYLVDVSQDVSCSYYADILDEAERTLYEPDNVCNNYCKSIMACNGDTTSQCSGGTSVYYSSGYACMNVYGRVCTQTCTDNGGDVDGGYTSTLHCACILPSTSYKYEFISVNPQKCV